MTVDELLTEQAVNLVSYLAKRFPRIPREDLAQEIWVAVLPHRDQLQALLDLDEPGKARLDIRQYATHACFALTMEQDRHDRAVKALSAGYEPADESFYSIPLLRKLVPAYLDNGITEEAPRGREMPGPGSGDPAESGNWKACMIDVDWAWWKISKDQRKTLTRYFSYPHGSGGWTHIEVASAMGVEPTSLEARVKRALRAMQRKLGGPNPWLRT